MTCRERFVEALKLGKPDRVPHFEVDVIAPERFLKNSTDSIIDILEIDNKCFLAQPSPDPNNNLYQKWQKKELKGYFIDAYGRYYQKSEVSGSVGNYHGSVIETIEELREYRMPEMGNVWMELRREVEAYKDRNIALVGCVCGFFDVPNTACGMENYLVWAYDYPEDIGAYLDKWEIYNLKQAELFAELGFDAIMIGEDMGTQRDLMISPDFLRKNIFPRLGRLVEKSKKYGLLTIIHSCGNINKILPELVEIGFNGINPLQPASGMSLKEVKEKYGHVICPVGNLDVQGVLTYGKPAEVKLAVKNCIEQAGYDGGYIFATSHTIMQAMPTENVLTMRDALLEYGKY